MINIPDDPVSAKDKKHKKFINPNKFTDIVLEKEKEKDHKYFKLPDEDLVSAKDKRHEHFNLNIKPITQQEIYDKEFKLTAELETYDKKHRNIYDISNEKDLINYKKIESDKQYESEQEIRSLYVPIDIPMYEDEPTLHEPQLNDFAKYNKLTGESFGINTHTVEQMEENIKKHLTQLIRITGALMPTITVENLEEEIDIALLYNLFFIYHDSKEDLTIKNVIHYLKKSINIINYRILDMNKNNLSTNNTLDTLITELQSVVLKGCEEINKYIYVINTTDSINNFIDDLLKYNTKKIRFKHDIDNDDICIEFIYNDFVKSYEEITTIYSGTRGTKTKINEIHAELILLFNDTRVSLNNNSSTAIVHSNIFTPTNPVECTELDSLADQIIYFVDELKKHTTPTILLSDTEKYKIKSQIIEGFKILQTELVIYFKLIHTNVVDTRSLTILFTLFNDKKINEWYTITKIISIKKIISITPTSVLSVKQLELYNFVNLFTESMDLNKSIENSIERMNVFIQKCDSSYNVKNIFKFFKKFKNINLVNFFHVDNNIDAMYKLFIDKFTYMLLDPDKSFNFNFNLILEYCTNLSGDPVIINTDDTYIKKLTKIKNQLKNFYNPFSPIDSTNSLNFIIKDRIYTIIFVNSFKFNNYVNIDNLKISNIITNLKKFITDSLLPTSLLYIKVNELILHIMNEVAKAKAVKAEAAAAATAAATAASLASATATSAAAAAALASATATSAAAAVAAAATAAATATALASATALAATATSTASTSSTTGTSTTTTTTTTATATATTATALASLISTLNNEALKYNFILLNSTLALYVNYVNSLYDITTITTITTVADADTKLIEYIKNLTGLTLDIDMLTNTNDANRQKLVVLIKNTYDYSMDDTKTIKELIAAVNNIDITKILQNKDNVMPKCGQLCINLANSNINNDQFIDILGKLHEKVNDNYTDTSTNPISLTTVHTFPSRTITDPATNQELITKITSVKGAPDKLSEYLIHIPEKYRWLALYYIGTVVDEHIKLYLTELKKKEEITSNIKKYNGIIKKAEQKFKNIYISLYKFYVNEIYNNNFLSIYDQYINNYNDYIKLIADIELKDIEDKTLATKPTDDTLIRDNSISYNLFNIELISEFLNYEINVYHFIISHLYKIKNSAIKIECKSTTGTKIQITIDIILETVELKEIAKDLTKLKITTVPTTVVDSIKKEIDNVVNATTASTDVNTAVNTAVVNNTSALGIAIGVYNTNYTNLLTEMKFFTDTLVLDTFTTMSNNKSNINIKDIDHFIEIMKLYKNYVEILYNDIKLMVDNDFCDYKETYDLLHKYINNSIISNTLKEMFTIYKNLKNIVQVNIEVINTNYLTELFNKVHEISTELIVVYNLYTKINSVLTNINKKILSLSYFNNDMHKVEMSNYIKSFSNDRFLLHMIKQPIDIKFTNIDEYDTLLETQSNNYFLIIIHKFMNNYYAITPSGSYVTTHTPNTLLFINTIYNELKNKLDAIIFLIDDKIINTLTILNLSASGNNGVDENNTLFNLIINNIKLLNNMTSLVNDSITSKAATLLTVTSNKPEIDQIKENADKVLIKISDINYLLNNDADTIIKYIMDIIDKLLSIADINTWIAIADDVYMKIIKKIPYVLKILYEYYDVGIDTYITNLGKEKDKLELIIPANTDIKKDLFDAVMLILNYYTSLYDEKIKRYNNYISCMYLINNTIEQHNCDINIMYNYSNDICNCFQEGIKYKHFKKIIKFYKELSNKIKSYITYNNTLVNKLKANSSGSFSKNYFMETKTKYDKYIYDFNILMFDYNGYYEKLYHFNDVKKEQNQNELNKHILNIHKYLNIIYSYGIERKANTAKYNISILKNHNEIKLLFDVYSNIWYISGNNVLNLDVTQMIESIITELNKYNSGTNITTISDFFTDNKIQLIHNITDHKLNQISAINDKFKELIGDNMPMFMLEEISNITMKNLINTIDNFNFNNLLKDDMNKLITKIKSDITKYYDATTITATAVTATTAIATAVATATVTTTNYANICKNFISFHDIIYEISVIQLLKSATFTASTIEDKIKELLVELNKIYKFDNSKPISEIITELIDIHNKFSNTIYEGDENLLEVLTVLITIINTNLSNNIPVNILKINGKFNEIYINFISKNNINNLVDFSNILYKYLKISNNIINIDDAYIYALTTKINTVNYNGSIISIFTPLAATDAILIKCIIQLSYLFPDSDSDSNISTYFYKLIKYIIINNNNLVSDPLVYIFNKNVIIKLYNTYKKLLTINHTVVPSIKISEFDKTFYEINNTLYTLLYGTYKEINETVVTNKITNHPVWIKVSFKNLTTKIEEIYECKTPNDNIDTLKENYNLACNGYKKYDEMKENTTFNELYNNYQIANEKLNSYTNQNNLKLDKYGQVLTQLQNETTSHENTISKIMKDNPLITSTPHNITITGGRPHNKYKTSNYIGGNYTGFISTYILPFVIPFVLIALIVLICLIVREIYIKKKDKLTNRNHIKPIF